MLIALLEDSMCMIKLKEVRHLKVLRDFVDTLHDRI